MLQKYQYHVKNLSAAMVTSRRHSRQQDGIRSIDRASGVPFTTPAVKLML